MNGIYSKIAEALLDASFEECERALSTLKSKERETIIAWIFKEYHKRTAERQCERIRRTRTVPPRVIEPMVRLRLAQRGREITVRRKESETKYSRLAEALAYAEALRDIYGNLVNTLGMGSACDPYTVRNLVPAAGRKARVRICISATNAEL